MNTTACEFEFEFTNLRIYDIDIHNHPGVQDFRECLLPIAYCL